MTRELCALLADAAAPCPDAARVPQLVALARTHRVHLVAAHQLARRTPTAVSGDLRAEMRVEALRDTLRVRELARVAAALEADGCDPVVFKGAALALTHYADSWLRPRLDADILVAPARPRPGRLGAGSARVHAPGDDRRPAGHASGDARPVRRDPRRARGRSALAPRQSESARRTARRTASCARAPRGPWPTTYRLPSPHPPTRWSSPVSTARPIMAGRASSCGCSTSRCWRGGCRRTSGAWPSTRHAPVRWRRSCSGASSSARVRSAFRCRRT